MFGPDLRLPLSCRCWLSWDYQYGSAYFFPSIWMLGPHLRLPLSCRCWLSCDNQYGSTYLFSSLRLFRSDLRLTLNCSWFRFSLRDQHNSVKRLFIFNKSTIWLHRSSLCITLSRSLWLSGNVIYCSTHHIFTIRLSQPCLRVRFIRSKLKSFAKQPKSNHFDHFRFFHHRCQLAQWDHIRCRRRNVSSRQLGLLCSQ